MAGSITILGITIPVCLVVRWIASPSFRVKSDGSLKKGPTLCLNGGLNDTGVYFAMVARMKTKQER